MAQNCNRKHTHRKDARAGVLQFEVLILEFTALIMLRNYYGIMYVNTFSSSAVEIFEISTLNHEVLDHYTH